MPADEFYAFDVSLHALPAEADAGGSHRDAWGEWPILRVPQAALGTPMAVGFDEAFARLAELERMFAEPDGSFVWTSPREGPSWQVDGNAFERDGRVLLVDLKGSCPAASFDRLLAAFGWPAQRFTVQLVRPAVFLEESTFRRHARCRAAAPLGRLPGPG